MGQKRRSMVTGRRETEDGTDIEMTAKDTGKSTIAPTDDLERTIGFKSAVSIAVAAMTGSCLVLPGGAVQVSGSSAFLAILLSGILATPHCFCVAELASAMPINGGEFVYLSKAYGPCIGTMCGVGLFASLLLKGSFGLVGSIYYLEAVTGKLEGWMKIVLKLGMLFVITCLNLMGMKKLKSIQKKMTLLATLLLFLLSLFAFKNFKPESMNQDVFLQDGAMGVMEGAAFVYMSYAGITKICSVGGEIKRPGETLPKSIKTAAFSMTLFFSIATLAITGLSDLETLKTDYAPFFTMGDVSGGFYLGWVTSVVCIITMIGMANVAIAAVSRFPYAMARDGLLPDELMAISGTGSPYWCILLSSFFMGVCILTIDVKGIAKLASSFNLIVFCAGDFSVMIYRANAEGPRGYHPEYRSPYYPLLPLCGIFGQGALLFVMGTEGLFALLVFGALGFILYMVFGRHNARFLGVVLPEKYFGILPDHFLDKIEMEKELMRLRKDPLWHYHHDVECRQKEHKAKEVSKKHNRKFDFRSSTSRTCDVGTRIHESLRNTGHDLYIYRIAFSGGHKGGKHSIMHLVGKACLEAGYDVYYVPKVSQFFANHGVTYAKRMTKEQKVIFQAEILRTQLRHERAFLRLAGLTKRPSVVLFNRGLLDLKAYCYMYSEEIWRDVLDMCEFDEGYLLDRYDMVLHCETKCEDPKFRGDVDPKKEKIIDKAFIECWQSHSDHVILNYEPDFGRKVKKATTNVLDLLESQYEEVASDGHESLIERMRNGSRNGGAKSFMAGRNSGQKINVKEDPADVQDDYDIFPQENEQQQQQGDYDQENQIKE